MSTTSGTHPVLVPRAAAALDQAETAAGDVDGHIGPGTLLAAVLGQPDGVAARAVEALNIDAEQLIRRTTYDVAGPALRADRNGWLTAATGVARRAGHGYVGTEHLVEALLDAAGVRWTAILRAFDTDVRSLRAQLWRTSADLNASGSWQSTGSQPSRDVLLAGDDGTPAHRASFTGTASPAVSAAVDRLFQREPIVGLSLAVVADGAIAEVISHGWSTLSPRQSLTAAVPSRTCSVTKIVTAMAVLRLSEQGRLHLDDPAAAYLRSLHLYAPDGSASRVTVRQLLTHTGGFGTGQGLRRYDKPASSFLQRYPDGLRAETDDGVWRYSNLGYSVLAQVVADVSGEQYADYVTAHVLAPLAMGDSSFCTWVPSHAARGHLMDRGRIHVVRDSAVLVPGAGDLVSTAPDLARLLIGLMPQRSGKDAAALARDTLAMMNAGEVETPPRWFRQGLGVRVREIAGNTAVGHNGSWPGYRAELWWMPQRRAGVAALANSETCGLFNLVTDILRAL